ncbi:hypothetical protein ACFLRF_02470 [Candidatus Altiarchaeota archaeon]
MSKLKKPLKRPNTPSLKTRAPTRRKTSLQSAGKRQTIYNIIHQLNILKVKNLKEKASQQDIQAQELKQILKDLEQKGLVYCPKPGVIGCVDD